MNRLSLRLRSFAAALLVLLFFVPLTAITLEKAFTNSLSQSMLDQLRLQSLTLISEFEIEQGEPLMPEQLFNEQLNIPGSGLYAFIQMDKRLVWQSLSTLNWQQIPHFSAPQIGNEHFEPEFSLHNTYFLFAYTAEFDTGNQYQPISFYILQDRLTFDRERRAFANTLWNWLGLISLLLLALLLLSLNAALSPIKRLNQQINQAERGEVQRISQTYPPELERLKSSINHLLDTEQQQRSRYKNSLSDLAHSLKTPLAVLSGLEQMPTSSKEPLNQIDNIIQRQLKRAVAGGGSGWEKAEPVRPVVEKLCHAMGKVYADKHLIFSNRVHTEAKFRGDKTDLMELLGNLLDNACKAAMQDVTVQSEQVSDKLIIRVEDDGPGIAPEHGSRILNRGARLDSYQEGQGIGLAVVSDLVAAYQGKLEIGRAETGGAQITLIFPV